MEERAPQRQLESFVCPRCSANSHQDWIDLVVTDNEGSSYFEDTPVGLMASPGMHQKYRWAASKCFSCKKSSVWRGKTLIFPPVKDSDLKPHDLMSADARVLFEEACAVLSISRRASAALARAAMEAELRHLLSDKKSNLHDLIGKLSNEVSTALWESLTVLRDTGNKALHGGDNGIVGILIDGSDEDLAEFLLSAVNQIVDEKVAKPQRANELYSMLPEGVRASAEQKREKSAD